MARLEVGNIAGTAGTLLRATPTGRPAETAGAAAAIGSLVAIAAGVTDTGAIAVLVGAVGLVPAAITGLINAGGVRGLAGKLWGGRSPE